MHGQCKEGLGDSGKINQIGLVWKRAEQYHPFHEPLLLDSIFKKARGHAAWTDNVQSGVEKEQANKRNSYTGVSLPSFSKERGVKLYQCKYLIPV